MSAEDISQTIMDIFYVKNYPLCLMSVLTNGLTYTQFMKHFIFALCGCQGYSKNS